MNDVLTRDQIATYQRDGFIVLRGYYDVEVDIRPIQRAIGEVICLVREHNRLSSVAPDSWGNFDHEFADLIAHNRRLGAVVYDAIKQIPAFIRLVASPKHEALYRQITGSNLVGVAGGGYGVRIDNPGEDSFQVDWHQEYPAQLRSMDGAVFWSPLVPVTEDMGPVRICVGSHVEGAVPVHTIDPDNPNKSGAYALILTDRETRIDKYKQVAPLMNPGDLLLMDFLTLHASGQNLGKRSRWSMQSRLFNFREKTGIGHEWSGSYAAGKDFAKIHPELIVDEKKI
jgi:hypothetical protein